MKLGKLAILVAALTVALVAGWSSSGEAITLPACDDFICAFDGNFAVMSLPFAGVSVPSTPGKIQDFVVVYTAPGGQNLNTNPDGMDNPFPSVTGVCPPNCSFSTTTTTDPGGTGQFAGDVQSWDSTLDAFMTFINGSTPLFFLNQNDTNSDQTVFACPGSTSAQDICIYGSVTLVDLQDSNNNLVFELESPTRLFSQGPGTTDGVADLPSELILAKGDVCLDQTTGAQVDCGSPNATQPVNHNLGQDHAAYVAFSDALNAALALCAQFGVNSVQCPWDSLSIRLDLDDLNNGFEQLFILTGEQLTTVTPIPEPGTLILLGAGLVGLGASAWRRRQRG
jgi:PEP-CTERM motif